MIFNKCRIIIIKKKSRNLFYKIVLKLKTSSKILNHTLTEKDKKSFELLKTFNIEKKKP